MQFTYALCDVVSQRAYVLEADATGMNTVKNQDFFFFFEFRKTTTSSKHN